MPTHLAAQKLLGNMVLMRASKNREIGNQSYAAKQPAYRESSYAITNQVAGQLWWGLNEIRSRQKEMAKIAVKTWPLEFGD
jgi:hypothetical protein